jgi:sulfite reductase alpha subunit-like flavoprotein
VPHARCFSAHVPLSQERAHQRSLGAGFPSKDLLFFGCRTRQHDFLYQSELESYAHGGDLKKLSVAFSRDQKAKVYVQDMIEMEGAAVWEALQQGGIIMVSFSLNNSKL